MIDMCQSMKFQSDREYLGQNYKDTGYLMKRTPRLNTLMTTMKQFYRVKRSINTLNNKNNKAKRNKE